jgi:transcriptional regulator with AAA-type ATPase domain
MKHLLQPGERAFARVMTRLVTCNHFLPERIALEREALGSAFVEDPATAWNLHADSGARNPNILRLTERTGAIVDRLHPLLKRGSRLAADEREGYENLVYYFLYQRYRVDFQAMTAAAAAPARTAKCFQAFARDLREYLEPIRPAPLAGPEAAQVFAGFCQLERAFLNIFTHLVGSSAPVARLRAAVWESIFTSNFKRYRSGLFQRMSEITTLISGPSGTGKELVAQAIASSGFIPFDPVAQRFAQDRGELFRPLNVSALSVNLVEAELFGHQRGAFTGALQDRAGWLEVCPEGGAVFLDEIGELDVSLQVKLLRVLQTRTFHRLGESRPRSFAGKIIAATNRDLVAEMEAGRFRRDFYYRLCSDVIVTPSLREQLADAPQELPRLVGFIARRLVGDAHSEELTAEVLEVVERQLSPTYAWPGNFRELEQCVRNVLVRRRYDPVRLTRGPPAAALAAELEQGRLTAEQVLRRYCSIVYAQTGNLEETARRLNIDRRTVKARLAAPVEG